VGSKNNASAPVLTDFYQSTPLPVKAGGIEPQATCKPVLTFDKTVGNVIPIGVGVPHLHVYQSHPKVATARPLRVSEQERQEIMVRREEGQSLRKISRQMGRARQTISRMVRANETDDVTELRDDYFELLPKAIESVRRAVQNDPWAAIKYLKRIGVIQNGREIK
jgi:hypothetical protein